ncbi:hypothetical protein L1987_24534 [Smallanthus sonchifolius]|uniref:Uncharacterized protein n=1 Tax=Smallanthus sonchifolius TaxID=185202 RepID=A0ACB9IMG5_9ASTR|nr:hypothetical protein L1987_24534 [Smallanthus sonchifolius]
MMMTSETKVTKDDPGPEEGSGRQEGNEELDSRSSCRSAAKLFPMYGGSEESGMGMEEENINVADPNDGSNKNAFFFKYGERVKQSAHVQGSGPELKPLIMTRFSLTISSKVLEKVLKHLELNQFKPSIPDLNSSMGGSANEVIGDRKEKDSDLIAKPRDDSQTGNGGEASISEKIEATMEMGKVLGVDLRNKVDLVRAAILGEGVKNGCP